MENSAKTISWLQNSKAVYHGVSKVEIVVGKYWDENNLTNVLDTPNDNIKCTDRYFYEGDGRRKCVSDQPTAVADFGNGAYGGNGDSLDGDDIDDYNGEVDSNIEGMYKISTDVSYILYVDVLDGNISLETASNNPTNIKKIEVKVTKNGQSVSTYRYYAVNIGTSEPYVKDNP